MNRGNCKGKKGYGGSTHPKHNRYVLGDVDMNIIGHRSGRTVWGYKQCDVNCCKKRECWLALPGYTEDTAIAGMNGATLLVEKEDNRSTDQIDSSTLKPTSFR